MRSHTNIDNSSEILNWYLPKSCTPSKRLLVVESFPSFPESTTLSKRSFTRFQLKMDYLYCYGFLIHWNEIVIILTKFQSLAALEILTNSGAANDENFVKMIAVSSKWQHFQVTRVSRSRSLQPASPASLTCAAGLRYQVVDGELGWQQLKEYFNLYNSEKNGSFNDANFVVGVQEVVVMATTSSTCKDKVGIVTTFPFSEYIPWICI